MTVAVTTTRIFLQQLENDALGHRIAVFAHRRRPRRGRSSLHFQQRVSIARTERQLPRQHFEEQNAERVEIRVRASLFAASLLGRHVFRRAKDRALGGQARVVSQRGQTEVQDLDEVFATAALSEQDVVALQIAVNDAEVVCASQGGAHLFEHVDAAREGQRPTRELRRQRCADQVLHHQVQLAVIGFADVVNVDDVSVVDAVGSARFAQHPCAEMSFSAQVRSYQFDRNDPIDEDVTGSINDAHPPFADARL